MSTPAGTVTNQPIDHTNQIIINVDRSKQILLECAARLASLEGKFPPGTTTQAVNDARIAGFKEIETELKTNEAILRQLEGSNHYQQADLQTLRVQIEQLRLNLK